MKVIVILLIASAPFWLGFIAFSVSHPVCQP